MRDEILEKITKELNSGIDTEPKALYLLVEIRKIRELENVENEPRTIFDFYCDWVVHTSLTYSNTTRELLGRFESHISSDVSAKDIARAFHKNEPDFFKLDIFKTELGNFLIENGLPNQLIEDDKHWYEFVRKLLNIMKECNLKPNNGSIKELSLEEDSNRNTSFKFRLRGRRDCPIVKFKWKNK